jgi:hypothetical protein
MIRFWNNDVFDNIDGVLQAALAALTEAEPQRIGPPQRAEVSEFLFLKKDHPIPIPH